MAPPLAPSSLLQTAVILLPLLAVVTRAAPPLDSYQLREFKVLVAGATGGVGRCAPVPNGSNNCSVTGWQGEHVLDGDEGRGMHSCTHAHIRNHVMVRPAQRPSATEWETCEMRMLLLV